MLFDFVSVSISFPSCTRGFAPHQHPRNQKTDSMIASVT
jgi:hypothetical protein